MINMVYFFHQFCQLQHFKFCDQTNFNLLSPTSFSLPSSSSSSSTDKRARAEVQQLFDRTPSLRHAASPRPIGPLLCNRAVV